MHMLLGDRVAAQEASRIHLQRVGEQGLRGAPQPGGTGGGTSSGGATGAGANSGTAAAPGTTCGNGIVEAGETCDAIQQYVDKLTEMEDLPIHVEAVSDADQLLDRDTQGVIFYIVEEAIGNARKHSQAKNIQVRLFVDGGSFVAEVEDDGVGFDVDGVQQRYDERGSLGMLNMYERADLIGGKLGIVSAPGEGTRIRIAVPLRRR